MQASRPAGIEDGEAGFLTPAGQYCVYPSASTEPSGVSYVRFVTARTGVELAYWTADEWKEDPKGVMGAILGALQKGA